MCSIYLGRLAIHVSYSDICLLNGLKPSAVAVRSGARHGLVRSRRPIKKSLWTWAPGFGDVATTLDI